MVPHIAKTTSAKSNLSQAVLIKNPEKVSFGYSSREEELYLNEKLTAGDDGVLYRAPHLYFFYKSISENLLPADAEKARKAGSKFFTLLKQEKTESVQITGDSNSQVKLAFLEGLLLAGYSFSKYKSNKASFELNEIFVQDDNITDAQLAELKNVTEAVFHARNLVNEPLSYLNAECLAEEIGRLGAQAGFTVEVFNKKKIEALRMGGLLAVNKGSIDPPTFTVLEWKPEHPTNDKPVVLVGKGVVYDTGGLSLKPTPKSMDYMKSDMAGGAVVAATVFAAATNKLPVHIVGLVPATDNRPDGNAYVPGDIITMYDGTTVEIRNTDAEGRLLLADALTYAKKFSPSLVIDVATLTGSAEIITGPHGIIAMGNDAHLIGKLKDAGEHTYERIVELPLWQEFSKPLESGIADLNNLGVREGQTSIAGKFLEHFTAYPWVHLDIAGVSFLHENSDYKPSGGTGFGVRMLYHFLKYFN